MSLLGWQVIVKNGVGEKGGPGVFRGELPNAGIILVRGLNWLSSSQWHFRRPRLLFRGSPQTTDVVD